MIQKERPQLTRRNFLKGAAGFFLPLVLRKEKKAAVFSWQALGPEIKIPDGAPLAERDGCRAVWVANDGQKAMVSTCKDRDLYFRSGGHWEKLDHHKERLGQVRQILSLTADELVLVADRGVSWCGLKKDQAVVKSYPFSESGCLQAGCCLGERRFLVGGLGELYQASFTPQGQFEIKKKFAPPQVGSQSVLIRSIVTGPGGEMMIGGWLASESGYSGQQHDRQGKILPGAGVFLSKDGGQNWEQVLADVNVNALYWRKPLVLAGTEGAGEWHGRKPDSRFPSVYLSFENGRSGSWRPLALKTDYDLVAPQQAFAFDRRGRLIISFWGGPVLRANIDYPAEVRGFVDLTPGIFGHSSGQLVTFQKGERLCLATAGKDYQKYGLGFSPLRTLELHQ